MEWCFTVSAVAVVVIALMVWDFSRIRRPARDKGMTAEEHERAAESWGRAYVGGSSKTGQYTSVKRPSKKISVMCDGGEGDDQ